MLCGISNCTALWFDLTAGRSLLPVAIVMHLLSWPSVLDEELELKVLSAEGFDAYISLNPGKMGAWWLESSQLFSLLL